MAHVKKMLLVGAAAAAVPALVQASVVLYEPFNYGSTAVSLSAVSGAATGLDGTSYTAGGTTTYVPVGLSFSNLQTTGGKATFLYHASETRSITRGIEFGLSSGTLFGSMLYSTNGAANNGISSLLLTSTASAGDTTAKLDVAGNEWDGSSGANSNLLGVRTFGTGAKAAGTVMTVNTAYLVLWQVSNVGATSGTQTVDAWALTSAQFDNFKSGGLTAAELNAATTGLGGTDVLQRVSHTYSGASGYFSLSNTDYLRLVNYRAEGTFDEIRLGTASLDEVTPIPEPTSLLLLGAAAMCLRRRHG